MTLHGADAPIGNLPEIVQAFIRDRLAGPPLGGTATPAAMRAALDGAITDHGLGVPDAWNLFTAGVVPNTVGLDSERFLAFIPVSPGAAAVWMDAAVGAASFSAEAWLEAAGAVAAENQTLRFLADAMGLPVTAGGCFMSGGSIGNLSALAVAREHAGDRRVVAVADTVHASVDNSLHLLGMTSLVVPTGADGRLTGDALAAAVDGRSDVGVVVASAGSTNAGVVDDLVGVAAVRDQHDLWMHVDGAYGAAASLLPERAEQFAGLGLADSVIVDPHKWLFAPSGSCALLYRDPAQAKAVHTQHGPYLDILHDDDAWNPSDYGYQLTRRASGLPLWFSLAVHGVDAHRDAIRIGIRMATQCASTLSEVPGVELVMQPTLGVVLFRREGWGAPQWRAWAADLLDRGVAFVAPTTWRGESVGRLVFMHPLTPQTIIDQIADSLR